MLSRRRDMAVTKRGVTEGMVTTITLA